MYAEEQMRLHNHDALKSLVFVEVHEPPGSDSAETCPRSSAVSAVIETEIMKLLLERKLGHHPV